MKRWMTRVATCGRCSEPLVAGQVSAKRGANYTCTTDRGCGRLGIKAEWLEKYIKGLILDVLSEESAKGRFTTQDVDTHELESIETALEALRWKLDEADRDHEADLLDRSRWLARTERFRAKQKALETQRDRLLRAATVVALPEGDLLSWWDSLEPETKREVVRLLFSSVIVNPAQNLGGRPDWDRIKVRWAA